MFLDPNGSQIDPASIGHRRKVGQKKKRMPCDVDRIIHHVSLVKEKYGLTLNSPYEIP
uniref:Uncharacterized protein n=1 Tax=Arion vulgaris TaxID=1028688 RepID=A0A0B7AGB5_9EUPU